MHKVFGHVAESAGTKHSGFLFCGLEDIHRTCHVSSERGTLVLEDSSQAGQTIPDSKFYGLYMLESFAGFNQRDDPQDNCLAAWRPMLSKLGIEGQVAYAGSGSELSVWGSFGTRLKLCFFVVYGKVLGTDQLLHIILILGEQLRSS